MGTVCVVWYGWRSWRCEKSEIRWIRAYANRMGGRIRLRYSGIGVRGVACKGGWIVNLIWGFALGPEGDGAFVGVWGRDEAVGPGHRTVGVVGGGGLSGVWGVMSVLDMVCLGWEEVCSAWDSAWMWYGKREDWVHEKDL